MKDLVQNTKEWDEWRRKGIGASDANIIMGKSDYCTKRELYAQKLGAAKKEGNDFVQRKGHRLEVKARAKFEIMTGKEYPARLAEHESMNYLRASLDGYNAKDKTCLEIKYCGEADFQKVKKGECLEQYYPQLQHQMFVTGYENNILLVITEEKDEAGKQIKDKFKTADMIVKFDKEYCDKLIFEELKFWDHVQKQIPLPFEKNDIEEIESEEMQHYFLRYKVANNQINLLNEQIEKATEPFGKKMKSFQDEMSVVKKYMVKNQTHGKMHYCGVNFNEYEVSGSIDWEKACKTLIKEFKTLMKLTIDGFIDAQLTGEQVNQKISDYAVDIDETAENFRKASRQQLKITIKKEKKMEHSTEENKEVTKKKVAKKVAKKKVVKKKVVKKAKKKVSKKK